MVFTVVNQCYRIAGVYVPIVLQMIENFVEVAGPSGAQK